MNRECRPWPDQLPGRPGRGRVERGKPGPILDVNPLELAATLVTLACVILGVKRNLWQFPVGRLSGRRYSLFVVAQQKLWADAVLQVFYLRADLWLVVLAQRRQG